MTALIEATSNQGAMMAHGGKNAVKKTVASVTYRRWNGKKILTMGRVYGD